MGEGMLFRTEPRSNRYYEPIMPDERFRTDKKNAGSSLTTTLLNTLAIGAISAVFFLPSGHITSTYSGEAVTDGAGMDEALSRLSILLQGESQELSGFTSLEPIATLVHYLFLICGVALHIAARIHANRN